MVAIAIDPFWTLALALLLDAAVGRPPWLVDLLAKVRRLPEGALDWADRRLNRETRTDKDRRARGALAGFALAGLAGLIGFWLDPGGELVLVKAALLASLFGQRGHFERARQSLELAHAAEDPHKVRRDALERLTRAYGADVVALALAYVAFGLGGVFAYGMIYLAAERWSVWDARYLHFGHSLRACWRVLASVAAAPASVLLVAAAAFTPKASPAKAFAALWGGAGLTRDERPGWPLATMAGALSLSFEGKDGWIGPGRAKLDAADGKRALYLYAIACLLHLTGWATVGFFAVA